MFARGHFAGTYFAPTYFPPGFGIRRGGGPPEEEARFIQAELLRRIREEYEEEPEIESIPEVEEAIPEPVEAMAMVEARPIPSLPQIIPGLPDIPEAPKEDESEELLLLLSGDIWSIGSDEQALTLTEEDLELLLLAIASDHG